MEQRKNEIIYLTVMSTAGSLLDRGLLTKKEYDEIRKRMVRKYGPEREIELSTLRLDSTSL